MDVPEVDVGDGRRRSGVLTSVTSTSLTLPLFPSSPGIVP